jgi:hypothetical protein
VDPDISPVEEEPEANVREEHNTEEEEPVPIQETPPIDETPETTVIENDKSSATSELESNEEGFTITDSEASQDDPLLQTKEIGGSLPADVAVNTMMVTDDPVTELEQHQILVDKDILPLIEINEIESPDEEEEDALVTTHDALPEVPVEAENTSLPVPPVEELISDDGISELNIPAPVIEVPSMEEEQPHEVVEEASVDKEVAVENTEDAVPEVEQAEVSEEPEEPAIPDLPTNEPEIVSEEGIIHFISI